MNHSCTSVARGITLLLLWAACAHGQGSSEPVQLPTEYISVGDYSGTANERIGAAIAAAMATGHKTVFFPNGTYALRSGISLNQGANTELHLVGESRDGVFLIPDIPYLEANYNGGDWQNGGARLAHMINLSSVSVFDSVDVSIQNMTIDMRHQLLMGEETITYNVVGHGVRVGTGWREGQFTVNHVTIRNVGSYGVGIQDRGGHPKNNITLTNLDIERTGSDAIDTKEASGDGNRNLVVRNLTVNEIGFLDTGAANAIDVRYRDTIIENVNLVSEASRSTLPGQTSSNTGINFRPFEAGAAGIVGATVSNVYIRGFSTAFIIHATDLTPHRNVALRDFRIHGQRGIGVRVLGTNHSGHAISDGTVDPAFGSTPIDTGGYAAVTNFTEGRWNPALTPLTETTFESNVSLAGDTYSPAWVGMVGSERVSRNPSASGTGPFTFDVGNTGVMQIDCDGLYNAMDQLIVDGTLNLDGELRINTIGSAPTTAGTFQIFEADAITGAFDTITLPTVPGLTWFTDNLTTDGTISLRGDLSINTLSPADDATNAFASANLVLTFNQPVQPGTGSMVLKKISDNSTVQTFDVTTDVVFDGSQITIDPAGALDFSTGYYVTIDPGAVEDLAGSPFEGLSGNTAWNFTTVSASTIVVLNTGSKVFASKISNSSTNFPFDAGASADMLVVALSSEKSGGSYSVTYNSHPLTHAVLGGQADIWHLDLRTNSYSGGEADLIVDYTGITTVNGLGIGAVSIEAGGEPIRLHTTAISASGTNAVSLTTTRDNAFVVASFNANGSGSPSVNAPLTKIYARGNIGSAQGAAGYENGVPAGVHSYSWTTGNLRKVVAASFVIHNFINWIADYNMSADTGLGDDPDGDRIPNAIEAFYGTHPGEPSQGLGHITSDGTTTTLTHPQSQNPPADLSLFYQWSTNLVDWHDCNPSGGEPVSVTTETADGTATVSVTGSGDMDRLFLRSMVQQN